MDMVAIRYISILLLCVLVFSADAVAQPGTSAPTNVRGAEYRRILPDHRVRFRAEAPDADTLQIDLGKPYDMNRNEEGVWTVTTDSLRPGFHYYSLVIDSIPIADPARKCFYRMGRWASGIEIPYDVDY